MYRNILACGCELVFSDVPLPDKIVHAKASHMLDAYGAFSEATGFYPTTVLEIGVQYGGSLVWWHEEPQSHHATVVGIDRAPNINAVTARHIAEHVSPGSIRIITGEATAPATYAPLGDATFDLIVDDGSHSHADITALYALLWPRVRPGGWYLIEDWTADHAQPVALFSGLAQQMIGYWPSPDPPAGVFDQILVQRPLIALRKPEA